uniref:F-box domain-containing protein n=1 Tax=Meloidogyne enterolobii TaxID=390850 RepID=A0A6V7VS84_MELEN|nr:unnamed protein product [Meloidogyne enterolobii]
MNSLPNEARLDVLKCLNFNQLFSVKQTNFYFRNLINKYEGELARMKFYSLSMVKENPRFVNNIVDLESGVFEFTLNDQLKEKWQAAVDKSIPLFLNIVEHGGNFVCINKTKYSPTGKEPRYLLTLPRFPKNIEEMIIVRCWLEHLFNCAFELAYFSTSVFNPQMINILFDNDKTIPLQFNIQTGILGMYKELFENILKFSLNHLLVSGSLNISFIDGNFTEQQTNILFNILINEGDKFPKIYFTCPMLSKLYDLITEYIATSRDFSRMVLVFNLHSVCTTFKLSERAENVEIKQGSEVKYTKYQIANIYNPK